MRLQSSSNFNSMHGGEPSVNWLSVLLNAFTMPIEMILRPRYGSMYFPPASHLFAAMLMIAAPLVASALNTVPPIFIAARIYVPQPGLFTLISLTKLFFIMGLIHGIRTAWLKLDLSREDISDYEGPSLLPFGWVPWGTNFWVARILYEPLSVVAIALYMQRLSIFDYSLTHFLMFSAFCLACKSFFAWHLTWVFLRRRMDITNAAPILADLIDGKATKKNLEKIHMVSFPKNTPPELRKAMVQDIAQILSQVQRPNMPGGKDEHH